MNEVWLLVAVGLLALSGLSGLVPGPGRTIGPWSALVLHALGSGLGLWVAGWVLLYGADAGIDLPWGLPLGRFEVSVDALSALFLVPVFLVPLLGSVYGLGYWSQGKQTRSGPKLRFFYGILAAAMALVATAHDGMLFLIAWEIMALAAYFLITTQDEAPARDAGWVYLIATHAGTLALGAMFMLIFNLTGRLSLTPLVGLDGPLTPAAMNAIFLLALLGFGFKAGLMPLHVWLPAAHAQAPSHVSAVLSGVMLKMGIYGLVRTLSLLPHPPLGWGVVLLVLGGVSAVLGMAFAIGQHDLKRLLAYSSIENIGIIFMGLGVAMLGRAADQPAWVALGLGGALLHVWNHALFKSLLFFSAGSVIHATGTRRLDELGGLAKTMPRTAAAFIIGATAICGLPPLNGFMSELLIYMGLFHMLLPKQEGHMAMPLAAMAAPFLAMSGALAAACFVRVTGAVFLGEPRQKEMQGHESPRSMLGPMALLAACCLAIGLFPWVLAPILDQALQAWSVAQVMPPPALTQVLPHALTWGGWLNVALVGLVIVAMIGLRWRMRAGGTTRSVTWDCGYAAPSPRMQYTATSFAQMLVDLFAWALRPVFHRSRLQGPFPASSHFESHVPETVLDRIVRPLLAFLERGLLWLRVIQYGRAQLYVLYILLIVVVLLLWP